MSIEVRVPAEITEYRGKILFGLTGRQLLSSAVGLAVGGIGYVLSLPVLGTDNSSSVAMLLAAPFFAFGFIRPQNYSLEEYLKIIFAHRMMCCKYHYQTGEENNHVKAVSQKRQTETTVSFFSTKSSTQRKREIKRQCKALGKQKEAVQKSGSKNSTL